MAVDSALSQSWSYHLNFKSVSFYGLDTRSERTPDQIVTKEQSSFDDGPFRKFFAGKYCCDYWDTPCLSKC